MLLIASDRNLFDKFTQAKVNVANYSMPVRQSNYDISSGIRMDRIQMHISTSFNAEMHFVKANKIPYWRQQTSVEKTISYMVRPRRNDEHQTRIIWKPLAFCGWFVFPVIRENTKWQNRFPLSGFTNHQITATTLSEGQNATKFRRDLGHIAHMPQRDQSLGDEKGNMQNDSFPVKAFVPNNSASWIGTSCNNLMISSTKNSKRWKFKEFI